MTRESNEISGVHKLVDLVSNRIDRIDLRLDHQDKCVDEVKLFVAGLKRDQRWVMGLVVFLGPLVTAVLHWFVEHRGVR